MIAISAQAFPPASGGIEDLMLGLAQHAADRGRQVVVLADAKPDAAAFDASTAPRFRTFRFGGPRPLRRFFKARRLWSLPDVTTVFCDSWKSLEALPTAPIPALVLVFAHGNEYPEDGRKAKRIRKALARADMALPVSKDTLARMSPMLPDGVPAQVTPPPIRTPQDPSPDDLAWAEALWDGAEGPRLLSLCRLIPLKGVDQAIRALAALGRGRLVVAGDGPDLGRLRRVAEEAGVSDRVRFAGRVEGGRKTALLRSAELFLQPGRRDGPQREGFGISYLEAGLAGLPCICGREGGAPEAVTDGETGLVVDGTDGEAVSAALRTLAETPELRARMSEAARRRGQAALWPRRIGGILALGAGRHVETA